MIEDEEPRSDEQFEEDQEVESLLDNLREREGVPQVGLVRLFAWGGRLVAEVDVEPGKAMGANMGWCVACGWPITDCDVHNEDELETIRLHEAGVHDRCDIDACPEAFDAEMKRQERRF